MSEFVFPGIKPRQPLSDMTMLMLLHEMRLGRDTLRVPIEPFKDWAVEQTSFPNFLTEAALAHVVADKVEAAYRRSDLLERRRELMEALFHVGDSDSARSCHGARRA